MSSVRPPRKPRDAARQGFHAPRPDSVETTAKRPEPGHPIPRGAGSSPVPDLDKSGPLAYAAFR
jgi:hypothetical protein